MTFKNIGGLSGLSGHIEQYLIHVDYSLEKTVYDLQNTGGLGGLSVLIEKFWAHVE